jgi:hypothetical protein
VWEINVDSKIEFKYDPEAPIPLKATPVTITATILDVDVTAKPAAPGPLKADSSQPLSLAFENRLGKAVAAAVPVEFGSATRRSATIGQGEQHLYEFTVPKGATSLLARVGGVGDAHADLDVYLLDCTEPEKAPEEKATELEKGNKAPPAPKPICGTVAKAADVGIDGEVSVSNPKAGRWLVAVDGYSVPDGPVIINTSMSSPTPASARLRSPIRPRNGSHRLRGRPRPTPGLRAFRVRLGSWRLA